MFYTINLYNHDISNFVARGILKLNNPVSSEEIKEAGLNLLDEFNWEEDSSYDNAYEILKCLAFLFSKKAKVLVILKNNYYKCFNPEIIKKVNQNYFREFQNQNISDGTIEILFKGTKLKTNEGYRPIETLVNFPEINLISERRENI